MERDIGSLQSARKLLFIFFLASFLAIAPACNEMQSEGDNESSAEKDVEDAVEELFEAMSEMDTEKLSELVTGEAREKFMQGYINSVRRGKKDNPDLLKNLQEAFSDLDYEIDKIKLNSKDDKARVRVALTVGEKEEEWEMTFIEQEGDWLWQDIKLKGGE